MTSPDKDMRLHSTFTELSGACSRPTELHHSWHAFFIVPLIVSLPLYFFTLFIQVSTQSIPALFPQCSYTISPIHRFWNKIKIIVLKFLHTPRNATLFLTCLCMLLLFPTTLRLPSHIHTLPLTIPLCSNQPPKTIQQVAATG